MNKRLKIFIVIVTFFIMAPTAIANLPVVDSSNLMQNIQNTLLSFKINVSGIKSLINQSKQLANDAQKITNQFKQLEYMAKNLKRMQIALNDPNMSNIQKLNQLTFTAQDTNFSLEDFQGVYDDYIQKDSAVPGIVLEGKQNQKEQLARKGNMNSIRLQQAVIESLKQDLYDVNSTISKSRDASGLLEVIQLNNELMAQQIKQSMRLQQLLVSGGNLKSAEYAELKAREDAMIARHNYLMSDFARRFKAKSNDK